MNPSRPYTHTLTCRMQAEPAALERLCQVTRIRGFRIDQMQVTSDSDELEIRMVLSGERSIDMLRTQLEKLHSVRALLDESAAVSVKQTA